MIKNVLFLWFIIIPLTLFVMGMILAVIEWVLGKITGEKHYL